MANRRRSTPRKEWIRPAAVTTALLLALVLLLGDLATAWADEASAYAGHLRDVVRRLTRLGQAIALSVAVLFTVVAGLRWSAAGGDPGEIDRAKRALSGAGIGYLIALCGEALLMALEYVTEYEY
ncbi:pilin [Nocardiopsis changdeensis]|uniref:pilin n=1 Tax=Nocardiopsis changdeensis TaxID=2831969 RepID=UPI003F45EF6C